MAEQPTSAFSRFVEWLGGHMIVCGAGSITLALASLPLGFAHSVLLYIAAGVMFLIAKLFILRWMFGPGMKSIRDLGFGSNRQALKYGLFMRGLDWRLSAVAAYGLIASVIIGFIDFGHVVSGAMLLAFMTFGAVIQVMRLNRFWPANSQD